MLGLEWWMWNDCCCHWISAVGVEEGLGIFNGIQMEMEKFRGCFCRVIWVFGLFFFLNFVCCDIVAVADFVGCKISGAIGRGHWILNCSSYIQFLFYRLIWRDLTWELRWPFPALTGFHPFSHLYYRDFFIKK